MYGNLMGAKTEFILNTLQGIWFDLQYLRDKVVIDPEIKKELTDRMKFLDDLGNDIRDNYIKINEEDCCGNYEIN